MPIPLYRQKSLGNPQEVSARGIPTDAGVFDTHRAGVVEQAIGKVGEAVGDAGVMFQLVKERIEKQKTQDKINASAQLEADYTRDLTNWEIDATSRRKGADSFKLIDEAQKFETDWLASKQIEDPDLFALASRKIKNHTSSRLNPISTYVKGQRDVVEKQTEDDLLTSKTAIVFKDTSPIAMNNALASLKEFYDEKVSNGYDPLTAKEKLREGTGMIVKASIEGQLASNDLNVVRKVAQDLKAGAYDALLDEKGKESYHKQGKALVDSMVKDIADEAKTTLVELKEARKAELDELEFDFNKKLYPANGGRPQLTQTEIRRKEKFFADAGAPEKFGEWLSRSKSAQKAFEEGGKGEYKTNKDLYAKIATDMSSDDPQYDVAKINSLRNKGLSNGDADKLVDRFNSSKSNPVRKRQTRLVLDQMKKDSKLLYRGEVPLDFVDEQYNQEVIDFTEAMKDPQTNPKEYFDNIIKPNRDAKIALAIQAATKPGFFSNFFSRKVDTKKAAEQKTKVNLNDWLKKAKAKNPDSSEQELINFYNNKYGEQ